MALPQLLELCLGRQRRLFLTIAGVTFAVILIAVLIMPRVYEATTTLTVGENRPPSFAGDQVQLDESLARTYARLLVTPSVVAAAARALPFEIDSQALEGKIDMEAVTGTKLLRITAADRDAARARTIANTYARVSVAYQRRSVAAAGEATLRELSLRIARLTDRIRRLEAAGPSGAAELAGAQTELASVGEAHRAMEQNLAVQRTTLSIASPATVPAAPARPKPTLYLTLGAIFALFLGILGVLVRESFTRRVREQAGELGRVTGLSVLGRIPDVRKRLGSSGGTLMGAQREAFQSLAAKVVVSLPPVEQQVLVVTSAVRGEGKSEVVARLGETLASTSHPTLMVSADLRWPGLHERFDVPIGPGLADLLSTAVRVPRPVSKSGLARAARPVTTPEFTGRARARLHLLPSGETPLDPAHLLSPDLVGSLFERLRELPYDYVLLDAPPLLGTVDSQILAHGAGKALLVFGIDHATVEQLLDARDTLRRLDVETLGLVVVGTQERLSSYALGATLAAGGRRVAARLPRLPPLFTGPARREHSHERPDDRESALTTSPGSLRAERRARRRSP